MRGTDEFTTIIKGPESGIVFHQSFHRDCASLVSSLIVRRRDHHNGSTIPIDSVMDPVVVRKEHCALTIVEPVKHR